jgi:periplasmic protein TonB
MFIMKKKLLFSVLAFIIMSNTFSQPVPDSALKTIPPVASAPGDEDVIFSKAEIDAAFPGGNKAWAVFLEQQLGSFNPADNGAPKGKYQVVVRFIVSKKGVISDLIPETNYGYGMEQKVIAIFGKSPAWKPALQNGRPVNSYRRQPVTFVVE